MRYRSRNTTPVATTDSAVLASQTLLRTLKYSLLLRYRASGTSLRVMPPARQGRTPVAYSAGFTATHWLPYKIILFSPCFLKLSTTE
ncbi:hypothetical protein [Nostoc sp.]|uniref:hypothetical protein n=1 Tax=Nostoc sp. TaxID=1180 RepID=UPI002FFCD609